MSTAPRPQAALDPVKVDPKHYAVQMENDQVRVLRINYGAHEKSVMHSHSHPDSVAVFRTISTANLLFRMARPKNIISARVR